MNFGEITIQHFLIIGFSVFAIGLIGISLNRRSLIASLISIELMLLAVTINFIALSVFWQNIEGQIFSLFILTVAAAEAAIGLAILICHFRNNHDIDVNNVKQLKG
jgi:NADH-quinone oxidoreductase subunit K